MTRMPNTPTNALKVVAALQVCEGHTEAAQKTMQKSRAADPERTVNDEIELFGDSWRDPAKMTRWADAMRHSGMPAD